MRVNRVLSSAPQGICAGFSPPYSGPYTVSKRLGYNVYELMDEEGYIVPRVPTEELKPAFFNETPKAYEVQPDEQASPETEQGYPENEPVSAELQESGLEKEKRNVSTPQSAKRKRGRPRKTRVVVKRAVSNKFDRPAKSKPTLNETLNSEQVLVVKRKRGRPAKEPMQTPIDVSPRRTRAQKAQMVLGQS